MAIFIALLIALLAPPPPAGATLTSARSTGDPLWFSHPSLGKGTITPIPGARFEVVVITIGEEPIEGDLRQFTLVAVDESAYEPIAAGGGADLIFPIDSMPLGRELGQILPNDAMVSLTRTTPATVMLEADAQSTVAFVFQVPEGASLRALRLPNGAELTLAK